MMPTVTTARRLGILVLASTLAAAPRPLAAAPRCTLAALHDPCDDVTPAPAPSAPVASPWLDDGAAPTWLHLAPPDDLATDHRVGSLVGLGAIYATLVTWMYFAWYYDQPRLSGFLVGGDGYFGQTTYAGGSDKLGHAHANLALTRGGAELLRWGGWSPRSAALISGSLSWALFLLVEVKDGYYYQLSPGDMLANTAGVALGMAMTQWPALDRVLDVRISYWPSAEYRSIVRGDFTGSDRINSVNFAEDYSGQTYFLAVHAGALPWPQGTPRPLRAALDYLELGVGFQATKYKPDPPDDPPYERRQRLFLGATIDLQHAVDRLLAGRRSRAARWTRSFSHGLLEVAAPPFTILPVVGASRSPDD